MDDLSTEAGAVRLVFHDDDVTPLAEGIVDEAVRRTERTSAAFIKELMRRIAQASLARDNAGSIISTDIDEALNDMLFAGGRLNVRLLGGAGETPDG